MSDQRAIDTLIRHLRRHVAELRRMRSEGVEPGELGLREQLIWRLQAQLGHAVRDLLNESPDPWDYRVEHPGRRAR
jgi:hypothetical protein